VLGHLDHLALLLDTLVASLAPPAIPRVVEKGVLGHMDLLALIVDALVGSLALPAISAMLEEGVLWHLNLLAPVSDALESPVALPVVSDVDVGMVRYGSGVFRPAEGREQSDPQREEEAKNGPGSNCLRIAIVHESSRRWSYGRAKSLVRGQPLIRKMSPRGKKGGGLGGLGDMM
jgi:hypothetical protein